MKCYLGEKEGKKKKDGDRAIAALNPWQSKQTNKKQIDISFEDVMWGLCGSGIR